MPPAPALAPAAPQGLALDPRGLDGLRRAARATPEEGLRQVSRQFEALFIGMLLKSMREATPSSGLLEGPGAKTYLSMLDQQIAQSLAGRGMKLADAMFEQMRRTLPAGPRTDAAQAAVERARAPATPAAATPAQRAASPAAATPAQPAASPAAAAAIAARHAPAPAAAAAAATAAAAAAATPSQPSEPPEPESLVQAVGEHVRAFVDRVGAAARAASAASGVPAVLIVAQAALESGWGRREIRQADGSPSFNLFGIKADRGWRGPVAEAPTTEYVDGRPQRVRARFRAYGSYEESFADYARFLAGNPRYAGVLSAATPAEAARGLHRAGYATDPGYAAKLLRIIERLR